MKKKLLSLLCVLAMAISLTACGSSEATSYTDLEVSKLDNCEALSSYALQLAASIDSETVTTLTETYNKEEMATLFADSIYSYFGVSVEAEFGAFEGLLTTYNQMNSDMGGIVDFGDFTSEINGKEIIVTLPVYGNDCNGTITFTYTNDIFCRFEEGECEANTSLQQKMEEAGKHMGDAALNTILGMGTVFCVLILISCIIASFNLFNGSKKKTVEVETETAPAAAAEEEEHVDDTELVAVITAAIAAYESANGGSGDNFVVRSIKKANRRN